MMSPGMEQRVGATDRDCTVTCQCGEALFSLAPGETILRVGATAKVVSASCPKCQRTTTVRVGVAHG